LEKARRLFNQEYEAEYAASIRSALRVSFASHPSANQFERFFLLFLTRGSSLRKQVVKSRGIVQEEDLVTWDHVLQTAKSGLDLAELLLCVRGASTAQAERVEENLLSIAKVFSIYRAHKLDQN